MPKRPMPRLKDLDETEMTSRQRALSAAIRNGPRAKSKLGGPFAIWIHAPEFGDLAQQLGAHCRYHTALSPRLSEFAILATAAFWRAQYEWFAHAPIAERAGVHAETIQALHERRMPEGAPADERALYTFITELYQTQRVSESVYKPVHALLGDAGTVELVGILGYYAMISMTLNVFNSPIPDGEPLPFPEGETTGAK
jgi:4-carboxymuconolactone decarboxylase